MKKDFYSFKKSSFVSVQNDLRKITEKLLNNETLKKLLFYQDKDCLKKPVLTQEETFSLINNNIRIIPKITVDKEALNYVIIGMDDFTQNYSNPEFRDCHISFDIICHIDQWNLGDYQLRPFLIAGEIDKEMNNCKLSGIGTLQFQGCSRLLLNNEFAGYTLNYIAVHGSDDTINQND